MSKHSGKKKMQAVLWIILLIIGLIAAGGAVFISQANRQKNELAEILRISPNAAIVAYTLDENGQPSMDGNEIFQNADTPLVMASTIKTVILAAYADAVERGELDPNEPVTIADLEVSSLVKSYLPNFNIVS